MKIFIFNEKIRKLLIDLMQKFNKHSANNDEFANNSAVIMDDNNDGIELLGVIDDLSHNDVL